MKPIVFLLVLLLLVACEQVAPPSSPIEETTPDSSTPASNIQLPDTTVEFLSIVMRYNESIEDSVNAISINQDYLKVLTDPEKAAIGYVATFIGNECWWDGSPTEERDNLDCKIITALGLGYQCSETHLGFLRKWFASDPKVLKELESANCPTMPYTSTIQNTFDHIQLQTRGNSIVVSYKANGINVREQLMAEWSEYVYFELVDQQLKLVDKKGQDPETLKWDVME